MWIVVLTDGFFKTDFFSCVEFDLVLVNILGINAFIRICIVNLYPESEANILFLSTPISLKEKRRFGK